MLIRPRHVAALAAITGVLCATACGAGQTGASASGPAATNTGVATTTNADDTIDFTAPPPLIGVEPVASAAAASSALPFEVVAPTSLGTPNVYISNSFPEAGLVYKDPSLGTYWVEERTTNWTTQSLRDLASCASLGSGCGDPGWTLTTLSDGTPAIEIGTPPDTAVIFLHNGVRFDVLGPPGAFTEQDGVDVANKVEAAA